MSFKNWLNNTKNNLQNEVKKFQHKDLMDAIVAGCAIVAAADGKINSEEKQKMAGYINHSQELRVFNMSTVIDRFNFFTNGFDFDHLIGKTEALKYIGKFRGKMEARVIVGVCCAIGAADGDFSDVEKGAVREICSVLDLNPGEFGL